MVALLSVATGIATFIAARDPELRHLRADGKSGTLGWPTHP
jgi:hypothetical protein